MGARPLCGVEDRLFAVADDAGVIVLPQRTGGSVVVLELDERRTHVDRVSEWGLAAVVGAELCGVVAWR